MLINPSLVVIVTFHSFFRSEINTYHTYINELKTLFPSATSIKCYDFERSVESNGNWDS
jgi:hypothetical protein